MYGGCQRSPRFGSALMRLMNFTQKWKLRMLAVSNGGEIPMKFEPYVCPQLAAQAFSTAYTSVIMTVVVFGMGIGWTYVLNAGNRRRFGDLESITKIHDTNINTIKGDSRFHEVRLLVLEEKTKRNEEEEKKRDEEKKKKKAEKEKKKEEAEKKKP